MTSVLHSGAFMPGPGGMGLNGPVVVTQATGNAYDVRADYRLVLTATPVSGNDGQVTVTVEAKGEGQVVASGTLSVELEEETGHGGGAGSAA